MLQLAWRKHWKTVGDITNMGLSHPTIPPLMEREILWTMSPPVSFLGTSS
jgi:hypothetical protein